MNATEFASLAVPVQVRPLVRRVRRTATFVGMVRRGIAVAIAVLMLGHASALASERYGFVTFPEDEHQHLDGWDYWWGAADLVMASGNRYTVGFAFNSHYGYGVTGHQIFPRQGPYKGLSILTADGPAEWGHNEHAGQFVREMSVYAPGVSDLLLYHTLDVANGGKDIGSLERTSLERETYRLRLDNDAAKVHPTGKLVRALVDVRAEMRSPPLLLGGTGQWWYGIPETYGYPSRSFQYMQSARKLTGTLVLQQPNGSLLHERVVGSSSTMVMVHEYDATPEDLFGGLALAQSTQIHPRFPQYYQGGMPWELIFVDLRNGAQLMFALLAFHETQRGTLTPLVGMRQPTYRVMATLRLPDGRSVALDDKVHVEHLSYREIVGRVPTFVVATTGMYKQSWDYRVSYGGGALRAGDGSLVDVPGFDLGVVPQFSKAEPRSDDRGNRQAQRVPFVAAGSYGGCPAHGFGWSELIVNWYGKKDPWFTGGKVPPVPARCASGGARPRTGRPVAAPSVSEPAPSFAVEGCNVSNPGTPSCSYRATIAGGIAGMSGEPGGWTVTIRRKGRARPIVVRSLGGFEIYPCGAILPGDQVTAAARAGNSWATTGNPGICY